MVMNTLLIVFTCFISQGYSRDLRKFRLKRGNVFDPPPMPYPNPESPGYPVPPYPIPATTMSPSAALLPKPPKFWDSRNPLLDSLADPINPNYGMGFTFVQPTILGGNVDFPVGNLMRPRETVGGTFGFVRPVQVRFGTQGGPFFPWQDKQYAKTIKDINMSSALRNRVQDESSAQNFANQNSLPANLPPPPPSIQNSLPANLPPSPFSNPNSDSIGRSQIAPFPQKLPSSLPLPPPLPANFQ